MEQYTNALCQDQTRLESAERKLEAGERELAESKAKLEAAERKLEAAELKREAQAFLSDEWKFYNEEVTRCSAMVTSAEGRIVSDKAMIMKLTPAPGTYSPHLPSHMHNTQPHNLLVDSLAPSAKREGGVAPARRTRLGCV